MADEIAQLGIAVDARPVDAASASLDKLTQKAGSAAAQVDKLQQTSSQAGASLKRMGADASLDKLSAKLDQTNLILRSIASSAGQSGSAMGSFSRATDSATKSIKSHNDNLALSSNQWTNLSYQLNDVASGLLSGQSPFTIMAQQGGQVLQVLQQGQGGVLGSLRAVGGALAGLATPAVLAATSIVAAGVIGVAAFIKWEAQIDKVNAALDGVGRRTGLTGDALNRLAVSAAQPAGLSTFESQDLAATFAGTGKIGGPQISGLISQTKNFARLTGVDITKAGEELAKAFADPAKGADELNGKLGFLDDRTRELIKTLDASGNAAGAQDVLLKALSNDIGVAADRTWTWSRAWNAVGNAASNALAATGRVVQQTIDPTIQEQYESAREARTRMLRSPLTLHNATVSGQLGSANELADDLNEQVRRQSQLASRRGADSRANAASITAGEIVRSVDPATESLKKLQDQYAALQTALNTPGALDVMGVTAKQAADAVDTLSHAVSTFTDGVTKSRETEANAIASINARTVAEREAVASERERIAVEGLKITAVEEAARREAAAAEVVARSTRSAQDRLDTANDAGSLAGLQSYQRSRQEILNRLRRQQIDDTGNPAAQASNSAAANAELAALQKTSVQGPIDQANRSVAAQIAMLKVQVATFGQSTSAVSAAAKEQELINSYIEAGVPLNDALRASIHETSLAYGTYADAAEKAALAQRKSIEAMDGLRSATSSALNTIADDIVNGKAKNIGRDLAKQIGGELIKSGISHITEGLLGQQGKMGGGLFGDFFGKLLGGAKPDGTPGNPVYVAMGGAGALGNLLGGTGNSSNAPGFLTALAGLKAANSNAPYGTGIGPLGAVTSSALPNINSPYANGGGPGNAFNFNMAAAAQAIKNIESSGGNYGAMGRVTASGDRAYGAYQVMGNNIAPWSQRYLGRTLTPSQFIGDPAAQDQIFQGEFGRLEGRYGLTGAAQAWFGGPGAVGQTGRRDINGTSVGGYGQQFASFYNQNGGQGGGMQAPALQQLAPQIQAVNSAAQQASSGVTTLSNSTNLLGPATQTASTGLGSLVNSLGSIGGQLGGMIGGRFGGQIGSGIGNIFSSVLHIFGFSEGGVMTPAGPRQLQRFANGGTSNQAAIFGEAGPEAAVPLPDGRSIPVSIRAPAAPQRSASSSNTFHIGGPTITIQGDASDKTISLIRDEVERSRAKTMSELQRNFPSVSQTAARLYG